MGQYYNVVTIDKDGNITAYDKTVNGQRTMSKLMEHSWWDNPFVSTMTKLLYHNPMRVAWVGDYADAVKCEFVDDYPATDVISNTIDSVFDSVCSHAWGKSAKTIGVKRDGMFLDGKYLVNHTLKVYVNCDSYGKKSDPYDSGYLIHPLPILTAIGNGQGGGDYWGSNEELVGSWALCEISVEDEIPEGYAEKDISFSEN